LDRVEVALRIAASEHERGKELVKRDLVQHDDSGPPVQRLQDPAVSVRIVSEVIEANGRAVGVAAPPNDPYVYSPPESREQLGAVIRDTGTLRRKGREVGDLGPVPPATVIR
jgi:hypothetical protein